MAGCQSHQADGGGPPNIRRRYSVSVHIIDNNKDVELEYIFNKDKIRTYTAASRLFVIWQSLCLIDSFIGDVERDFMASSMMMS